MNIKNTEDFKEIAKKIRKHIILMTAEAGTAHYMSSISSVEILVSLYYIELNHYPENPESPEKDRFVIGKGHAAPAIYAVLAETGYFLVEEERVVLPVLLLYEWANALRYNPSFDANDPNG